MRVRHAVAASDASAEQAALERLAAGGSAVSAVLAGFFAVAGARPGALLGPISILVAGVGQGARAFDGRLRQPGLGAKRPRGVIEGTDIPDAAHVAVPGALGAAVIAQAYASTGSWRTIVTPAITQAQLAGAERRAACFERLAQVGALALQEPVFRSALLHAGSPAQGGTLSPSDLELPDDVDVPALTVHDQESRWLETPWARAEAGVGAAPGRAGGICAADSLGVLAALMYRVVDTGVWIEELELIAPLAAVPVRRGIPRVKPGTRLEAPSAMGIRLDESSRPVEAIIEPDNKELDLKGKGSPRLLVRRDPETRLASALRT